MLEELASWYRDPVVVAAGAEQAAVHADRLDVLREEQLETRDRAADAETAAELVPRCVARHRGIQPQSGADAGGALRPVEPRVFQRLYLFESGFKKVM